MVGCDFLATDQWFRDSGNLVGRVFEYRFCKQWLLGKSVFWCWESIYLCKWYFIDTYDADDDDDDN